MNSKFIKKNHFTIFMLLVMSIALSCCSCLAENNNIAYRYYYQQLDADGKLVYDYVIGLPRKNAEYSITLNNKQRSEEEVNLFLSLVGRVLKEDLPEETAWLSELTQVSYNAENGELMFRTTCIQFYNENDYIKMQEIMDIAAENINPSWDDYTKAEYISNAIFVILEYDTAVFGDFYNEWNKTRSYSQSLIGIVHGTTVCTGYARLYKALADRAGLPCVSISSNGHAFNRVLMDDGLWYGVEPQDTRAILYGKDTFFPGDEMHETWNGYFHDQIIQPEITAGSDYVYTGNAALDCIAVDMISIEQIRLRTEPSENFIYEVNDDGESTCTIIGYKGKGSGDLFIPEMIDGYRVTRIGISAFDFCSGFNGTLYLPDSIISIGDSAFAHCTGLTGNITLPENLETLGACAFIGCTGFDGQLIFNSKLRSIGNSSFALCSNLTGNLALPENISFVGERAFSECISLNGYIYIPASLQNWSSNNTSICKAISEYRVSEDNPFYSVIDGILYNKDRTELINCPTGYAGVLTIPEGVVRVASTACNECEKITKVILPDTLTEVGAYSFARMTGLNEAIRFPKSLQVVGDHAFQWTSINQEIHINKDMKIGTQPFVRNGYNQLFTLYFEDGVETIPNNTYDFIGPINAYIPDSVSQIGENAFYCPRSYRRFGSDIDYLPVTIYANSGSYAQQYAQSHGYDFIDITRKYTISESTMILSNHPENETHSKQLFIYADGEEVDNVIWVSEDPDTVSVNENGIVTGCRVGQNCVWGMVPDGSKLSCYVYVKENPLQSIEFVFNDGTNKFALYDVFRVSYATSPLEADWDVKRCYSDNENVVRVLAEGSTFYAVGIGEANIYVETSNGLTASAKVTVCPRCDSYEINEITPIFGEYFQFEVTSYPENTECGNLKWKSSDESILYVSPNGMALGYSAGTVIVSAADKVGNVVSREVTVSYPVEISFDNEPLLYLGFCSEQVSSLTLQVNISDMLVTKYGENIHISIFSENPAIVNANDNRTITAMSGGTTRVYAVAITNDGQGFGSNSLEITVKEAISLNSTNVPIILDETNQYQLYVTSWDDSITNREIVWSVEDNNPQITVDQSGLVTINGTSSGYIRAENPDGYIARCYVCGIQYPHDVTFDTIYIQPDEEKNIYDYIHFMPDNVNAYSFSFDNTTSEAFSFEEGWRITGINEGTGILSITEVSSHIQTEATIIVCQHELVHNEYLDPSCTVPGHTGGEHCIKCGYTTIQELPALGQHIPGCPTVTPAGANNGSVSEIVCTVCGEHLSEAQTIQSSAIFTLPSNLNDISDEAFIGISAQQIVIPNGCSSIRSNAFADCSSLKVIIIPSSVTFIAKDAFSGCSKVVICSYENDYALQYAETNNIPYCILN